MTVPVFQLPTSAHQETIDFLRRLFGMPSGGRNAATMIDTLSKRATIAEQLFKRQQDDHARNLELRELEELAGR